MKQKSDNWCIRKEEKVRTKGGIWFGKKDKEDVKEKEGDKEGRKRD